MDLCRHAWGVCHLVFLGVHFCNLVTGEVYVGVIGGWIISGYWKRQASILCPGNP